MHKSLRVVILTTKLPEDIWFINKVSDVCSIEGIVLPKGRRWKEYGIINVLKKRIRHFGIFYVANQALLILYRLLFEQRKDKMILKEIFTQKPYDHIEKKDLDIFEVDNINSEEVIKFIQNKDPEIILVSGTPLLKKPIIQLAGRKLVNLHPGFAPQYRGRYGAFWPIYNKEPQFVGTTVHFIDNGIDTGAILAQESVDFGVSDTLKTITYKQQKVGVDLIMKCITDFDKIVSHAYYKAGHPSKNYYVPGLTHYLKAKKWLNDNSQ